MRVRKNSPVDAALNDEEILTAAKMADALAHPVRIRILRYILAENFARKTVTNKDLVAVFDYAQATISQHLSKLLIGGLIEVKKQGTSSCYYARVGRLSIFTQTLKKIEPQNDAGEIPEFLRTELFARESVDAALQEELHPDAFDDFSEEIFDDTPRYL